MTHVPTWLTLADELDRWQRQGRTATFWWRDDDAVEWGPAIARLRTLSVRSGAPVALAVIPAALQPSLVRGLAPWSLASVCQHGYAHVDHSGGHGKKIELGGGQPQARKRELELGRARLCVAFTDRFCPVLVPPWNRIDEALVAALPGLGFQGLSTFKAISRKAPRAVAQNNCHVDVVDWHAERGFVGEGAALEALVTHLRERREGEVADECTGILTHHLVHDEGCWMFLERLFSQLHLHSAARVLHLSEIFE